jgi:hypothetical protein
MDQEDRLSNEKSSKNLYRDDAYKATATTTTTMKEEPVKFAVLKSFLTKEEQKRLVEDVLKCHTQQSSSGSTGWTDMATSTASFPLKLGIKCGGDLMETLPFAVDLARRAFASSSFLPHNVGDRCSLTGLALIYGPNATMNAHCDSPTQPHQREEWLAMMTVGNSVRFRCNDELLLLHSGDALVMDSMAVLHGVQEIVASDPDMAPTVGLPVPGSRLGVLLWQGSSSADVSVGNMSEAVELEEGTMAGLFGE